MKTLPKWTGLVLAGGRSRRMGRDKRALVFAGETLLERAVRVVHEVTDDVAILVADPGDRERFPETTARWIADADPGAGPLGALVTALEATERERAILLAVDHARVGSDLLRGLEAWSASEDDVVVPVWEDVPQVTCALYAARIAGTLREAYDRGERSLRRCVERLPFHVRRVPPEEWSRFAPPDAFASLNTPEDYEALTKSEPRNRSERRRRRG